MKTIAFCLFKYFPHGGLQRDFLRVSKKCREIGAAIRVYTMSWNGSVPDGFDVQILPVLGGTNHGKAKRFASQVQKMLKNEPVDLIVGFNKIPGLDIYFASDVCYAEKIISKSMFYRMTSRCRSYLEMERAVFDKESYTRILLISPNQVAEFQKHYSLDSDRFILLPPGLDEHFRLPENPERARKHFRSEFGLSDNDFLLLQVGSAFKTKGVDRAIRAVASLPESLKQRCVYIVVGKGKQHKYKRLANMLGMGKKVIFAGVREDVSSLMAAADILIHPGRIENTGLTLLESLASSLPVICSGACGYAPYITDSSAGVVLDEPFDQCQLNMVLKEMLTPCILQHCREAIKSYRSQTNLCGLANKASEYIMGQLG
jgi:UDP-glucose:(heptosyl)LPS alpha-1,3-glucosyltransferase